MRARRTNVTKNSTHKVTSYLIKQSEIDISHFPLIRDDVKNNYISFSVPSMLRSCLVLLAFIHKASGLDFHANNTSYAFYTHGNVSEATLDEIASGIKDGVCDVSKGSLEPSEDYESFFNYSHFYLARHTNNSMQALIEACLKQFIISTVDKKPQDHGNTAMIIGVVTAAAVVFLCFIGLGVFMAKRIKSLEIPVPAVVPAPDQQVVAQPQPQEVPEQLPIPENTKQASDRELAPDIENAGPRVGSP